MTESSDRHAHLESRVARVEASIESLSAGQHELKDLMLSVQRTQRQELGELASLIDAKTKPQPAIVLQLLAVVLTVAGAAWLVVSDQIEDIETHEAMEAARIHERMDSIDRRLDKRYSDNDDAQDERLRALERVTFGEGG